MTAEPATVGIVGLGRMGGAMAQALAPHFALFGWDLRTPEVRAATTVARAAELAERCAVVLLSLPSPEATRTVLLEPSFRAAFEARDVIVVDTRTSDPASLRELAAVLGASQARLLDAPILGRPDSCGRWTIPVGGPEEAFRAATPVLSVLAQRLIHVGHLGAGHTIKLLNNMMFAAINVITAEAIGAAERLSDQHGISGRAFVDVVEASAAATVSPLFRELAPRMLGETGPTVFTTALLHKDLQLAVKMCETGGVPLIAARALQIATSRALEAGLGDRDSAALIDLYRPPGDDIP